MSNRRIKFFEKFSKNRVTALSKVPISPERLKLKMWALRSFVDLQLAVLMNSKKLKINIRDLTRDSGFQRTC